MKTIILTWKARWRKRFLEECFFSWSLCARQILPLDISCCFERVRSKGCAVTRASASHQYGLGSNPAGNAIYVVSLLLVLALATRGFSLGISVFSSPPEPIVSKSNSIRNDRRRTANLDVLPPNCYLFIFYPSTHPSIFPSAYPSLLPSEAQKSQFSLQGETVDEVRLEQNESAVRFVSSSHCITLPSGLCCVRSVLPFQWWVQYKSL